MIVSLWNRFYFCSRNKIYQSNQIDEAQTNTDDYGGNDENNFIPFNPSAEHTFGFRLKQILSAVECVQIQNNKNDWLDFETTTDTRIHTISLPFNAQKPNIYLI